MKDDKPQVLWAGTEEIQHYEQEVNDIVHHLQEITGVTYRTLWLSDMSPLVVMLCRHHEKYPDVVISRNLGKLREALEVDIERDDLILDVAKRMRWRQW